MTSFVLSALLQVATAAPTTPTLETAIKTSTETGRPVLVLVGAEWCRYCKIVERDVLPKLKENGLLDKVEFVYLDYDRDRRLVMSLLRGEIIPEMIMACKTPEGWKRTHLSGGYKLDEIEAFIKSGLPPVKTASDKQ